MKINKGFLKIIHGFPYPPDATPEEKRAVVRDTLNAVKANGYDGVVSNVAWRDGYPRREEDFRLLEEVARICRSLGLRLWIYDERGYPSGAAGTATLDGHPELEALALAAVYRVAKAGERVTVPLPHGHRRAMGGFGFFFDGDRVSEEDLRAEPIRVPFSEEGYVFDNHGQRNLLCLSFFTKPAFEGTHCQHNAFAERRYIDLAHPRSGQTFLENTYRPYVEGLKDAIADGTVEAFFMDEPSYMAVYFNLGKKPAATVHTPDPLLPLWAMVNWSSRLAEEFFRAYGYHIEEHLPALFLGSAPRHRRVRQDFYTLLSRLAESAFFHPISEFCRAAGVASSGHILLEEKITDHPAYEGNFFTLLKHMHVPGMDMLDSLPERIFDKAFTPSLIRSVSILYADGRVMDEVSCHFQGKRGITPSAQQIFTSLTLQYALGANLFTSYYQDAMLLQALPSGETVLAATKGIMNAIEAKTTPSVILYYPIEAVMARTASPVDVAHVYDSSRQHEFYLPYPIRREDMDADEPPTPLISDENRAAALAVETGMEACMYALLNGQIPFLFSDTDSICRWQENGAGLFILPPHEPSEELLQRLPALADAGWEIVAVTDGAPYEALGKAITSVDGIAALNALLRDRGLARTAGDTEGVVALWGDGRLLLVNSESKEKRLTLKVIAHTVTDRSAGCPAPFVTENGQTRLTLPPYGVLLIEFDA